MDFDSHAGQVQGLLGRIKESHVPKILLKANKFPKWHFNDLIKIRIVNKKLHKLCKTISQNIALIYLGVNNLFVFYYTGVMGPYLHYSKRTELN